MYCAGCLLNLLKDIPKLTKFCHTGMLEVFHSLLTKYCPKRQHFGYKGMMTRIQLVALDHNYNIDREQATTSKGIKRYKVVFPKATKAWVAKPIAETKSYQYLHEISTSVLKRRSMEHTPIRHHKAKAPPVDLPKNIAGHKQPPKEEIIRRTSTRFN